MLIIKLVLETIGASWLIFVILIWLLGGKVDIKLKNPFTKKLETITDITIEH